MTLVDTSIWSEHFSKPLPELTELIDSGNVYMHPMVLGELSLKPHRDKAVEEVLVNLSLMEALPQAEPLEVMDLVTRFKLWGRGIGWVDCNLLASAREAHCHLLTRDKALKAAWLQVRPKD